MNIEELKLVLDTVAAVTDDAKTVAIWYIVASYGLPFIANCLVGLIFYGVVRLIVGAFASSNEWAQHGKNVARAFGGEGSDYSYERDSKLIDKAIAKAKETK
jgi:hypothetical protein